MGEGRTLGVKKAQVKVEAHSPGPLRSAKEKMWSVSFTIYKVNFTIRRKGAGNTDASVPPLLPEPRDRAQALPVKNRLRVLRAERDWSQADLARRLGVSRQTINAIETERYDPSLPLAFKIAQLFGKLIEEVFEPEGTQQHRDDTGPIDS